MSYNLFGKMFRVTTWGESHGIAIGAVIDGCPPNISLDESDISPFMERRRPGKSKYVTQRQEKDEVQILSGTFEEKTTGTPISLVIYNNDQRSKDYSDIKDLYRPGHADYAYDQKYGIRDYRGGGRSSARETAMRVASGAVASKVLKELIPNISITASMTQMGEDKIDYNKFDSNYIEQNPFFCADKEASQRWENILDDLRKNGDSVGGIIDCKVTNMPTGLGAPLYSKLDADIAQMMMGLNAVKGVEIGNGFDAASLTGSKNADEMNIDNYKINFSSNNAGGVLGGISTGQDLIFRVSIKPTSSILTPRKTISKQGENADIITKGRHDPCVAIRAVPVIEAMTACIILDHYLLHRAQMG